MTTLIILVRTILISASDFKGVLMALGIAVLIGVAIYVHEKSD